MNLKVALFAFAKEQVGANSVEIEVSPPATISSVKSALRASFPELADIISRSAFSVDQEFAFDGHEVDENSEIALIPPVSGG